MKIVNISISKAGLLACFYAMSTQCIAQSSGLDLNQIIPSLYGGNGVTLQDNPFFSHRADFSEDSLIRLQDLSESLSDFTQPTLSSNSGLTYEFDPVLDEFVQTDSAQSLGPSLTERPKMPENAVWYSINQ